MTHTDGPWHWYTLESYQCETDDPYHFIQLEEDGGWRNGEYMAVSGICSEANARLIAAAPDLLAALKLVIGPLRYAYGHVASVTADKVKGEILPAIEAAIARATGEAP